MDLPLWLQKNSPLVPYPSKTKQSNFIQKTLKGVISFVEIPSILRRSLFVQGSCKPWIPE